MAGKRFEPSSRRLPAHYRLIAACAAILVAAPLAAQQRFDLNGFRRLIGVSSPAVAPDGRSVAFIVRRPDFGRNRYTMTLMLADVAH